MSVACPCRSLIQSAKPIGRTTPVHTEPRAPQHCAISRHTRGATNEPFHRQMSAALVVASCRQLLLVAPSLQSGRTVQGPGGWGPGGWGPGTASFASEGPYEKQPMGLWRGRQHWGAQPRWAMPQLSLITAQGPPAGQAATGDLAELAADTPCRTQASRGQVRPRG